MYPIPVSYNIAKICILLSHNDPKWKILKEKRDSTIHGVAASLQNQILPQHYEHIVHQRQLAKLPMLGSEQTLLRHIFLSIWKPTEGELPGTSSFFRPTECASDHTMHFNNCGNNNKKNDNCDDYRRTNGDSKGNFDDIINSIVSN